jgi:di-N-acetylchitobiase
LSVSAFEQYLSEFVNTTITFAQAYFMDGANVDYESVITTAEDAAALTNVVATLSSAAKAAISPLFQVSVDVAWSPRGIDERDYDYAGLGKAADILFGGWARACFRSRCATALLR